ncbi:MAG: DUF5668 domain-containing protein [Acidobacteriota bacterium]
MKCSYHPDVDSQEACTVCRKLLCTECAHKIKGKPYCQDCLVQGAEWAATVKGLKLPSDSPKRAAFCAIIPGMGAVYNGEYMKAITYFAVFAALSMMGDRVNGVFGFGAFVFVLFTMFDAYRTAEAKARRKIQAGFVPEEPVHQDKTIVGWGILLIILGVVFLLQNLIPYHFLNRLWPVVFILVGAYLVYRAIEARDKKLSNPADPIPGPKEDI